MPVPDGLSAGLQAKIMKIAGCMLPEREAVQVAIESGKLSQAEIAECQQFLNGGKNWGIVTDVATFLPPEAQDLIAKGRQITAKERAAKKAQQEMAYRQRRYEGQQTLQSLFGFSDKDIAKQIAKAQESMKNASPEEKAAYQKTLNLLESRKSLKAQIGKEWKEGSKLKAMGMTIDLVKEAQSSGPNKAASPLQYVAMVTIGLVLLGMLAASCSTDDDVPEDKKIHSDDFDKDKDKDAVIGGNNVYVTNIVNVNIPVKVEVDMDAVKAAIGDLINANNANFAAVLSAIAGLTNAVDKNGQKTKLSLDALLQVAQGILSASGTIVENQDKILAEIKAIRAMVQNIDATVNKIDADLTVNGQNVKAELEAILEAVKAGNITVEQFKAKMEAFGPMLKEIILNQKTEIKLQETANMTLDEIKALLNKPDLNLDEIIAILNDIKSISADTNQAVKDIKNQLRDLVTNVTYIGERVKKIAETEEEQKALLEAILEAIKAVGSLNSAENQAILEALLKQGNSLQDIMAILKSINNNVVKGNETTENYGKQILAAVKAGNLTLGDIKSFVTHIDNDLHKNGAKIDDALAILKAINTNVAAGNKIAENYGKQILEAVKAGNLKLDDIRKLVQCIDNDMHKVLKNQDVIIDNQNTGLALGNAIFAWLKDHPPVGGGGSDIDYTAMLNKMYAKLDEILKAIKDHDVHVTVDDLNITVDLEGKVTCECNCGGHKHEGILGDLNDLIN